MECPRLEYYRAFAEQVEATKRRLAGVPDRGKAEGKSIAGLRRAGQGQHALELLRHPRGLPRLHGGPQPVKQGKFLPGTHIPIFAPEQIAETRPDYVLILPWNLKEEIIEQLAYTRAWGGRFVVPIPEVQDVLMKVVLFCGGLGMRLREYPESSSQAHGADRLPADPVARDEVLRPLRAQGLHPLPGLSRRMSSRTTS